MTEPIETDLVEAARAYSRASIDRFAGKAISKMKKVSDFGAHPHGWDMRTLWSLYSWDVQNGPFDNSQFIRDLVENIVETIVECIPAHEARLLSLSLAPYDDEPDMVVINAIMEAVASKAAARNLDRYDPEYRWYENL